MGPRGLKRSLSDFSRHPWLHLITVATITMALLILGGVFLCYRNFEGLVEKASPRISGTAYLKDGLTEPQIQSLRERVLSLGNVMSVNFKNKRSVIEDLQNFLGTRGRDSLPGSELFPDVLELELRNGAGTAEANELRSVIGQFSEVSEVDFSEDWLQQYKKVRQMASFIGAALLLALLIGCSFIIANFMGMRHQSRKEEIDIVRLFGAGGSFVLTPFLWEGVIEGCLGAFIALILLYLGKVLLTAVVTIQWTAMLGVKEWVYLSPGQLCSIVFMGMLMAIGGSVTVFFRFQNNGIR